MYLLGVLFLVLAAAPALAAEVTGYVESRTQYSRSRVHGLLPTDAQPEVQQILELNAQPRHEYRPGGFVAADLSLFLQGAWRYRGLDTEGQEVGVPVREASAARPFVSLSELYVSHEVVPALHLLAGKKRILWGTGWAYNPTDLLNPPKDPTDPTSQRVGAYMLRVEVPLEKFTFSLVASPAVLEQESGLPRALLVYPEWNALDHEAHYLLAARAYALVANADLNLMLFHSNLYRDDFEDKTQLGFSFSRYFFDDYELHVEALVGRGSARSYPTPGCLDSGEAAVDCFRRGEPLISQRRLEEKRLRPRILVGTRYQFSDESLLSAEYLYQADGLKRSEFQDVVSGLSLLSVARELGLDTEQVLEQLLGGTEAGLSQRFRFVPISRHYAFLTFQKPKIRDDFTVSASLIANLRDLSGLLAPSVAWSTTEWMTLTLSGFVPFSGPSSLAATVPATGEHVSEFELIPSSYRVLLQARLFY
ncbi:hypothetical protein [Hyalangium sp.]|uniref:hypothetical protein n=1 Tax=Hyalangium sp. TaxID=2028555 RepID=UPI002D657F7C|nr:hypothetical protein [Hyalangium sp.]HYI00896.1 hypothetical protein [Hyalangium sp.]